MTDGTQELDVIFDKMGYTKNTDFRKDAIRLITDWHNRQVKNAAATAEDNLDQYWNKELNKQIEALDRLDRSLNWQHTTPRDVIAEIEAERNKLKEVK